MKVEALINNKASGARSGAVAVERTVFVSAVKWLIWITAGVACTTRSAAIEQSQSTPQGRVRFAVPSDSERATQFGAAIASVGDLDGDGLADIAVGAPLAWGPKGRTGAVLFIGSASWGLLDCWFGDQPFQCFGSGFGVTGVFDSSPHPSLVVASRQGNVVIRGLRNRGRKLELEGTRMVLGTQTDLDGDGSREVVVAAFEGRVRLARTVSVQSGKSVLGDLLDPGTFLGADVNGDRVFDFVECPYDGELSLEVRFRSGRTGTRIGQTIALNARYPNPLAAQPVVMSLNQDKRPDIVIGLVRADTDSVLALALMGGKLSNPVGVPGLQPFVVAERGSPTLLLARRMYAMGDLSNDGVDDILAATIEPLAENDLDCYCGKTGRQLWRASKRMLTPGNSLAAMGDVDRDGVVDIAVAKSQDLEDTDRALAVDAEIAVLSGRTGAVLHVIREASFPNIRHPQLLGGR